MRFWLLAGGIAFAAAAGCGRSESTSTSKPPLLPADQRHLLSETGLFEDIAAKKVSADARPFEPRYTLWSDDAAKLRWVRLPAGTKIDNTDPDHWEFPVGTQFFKEFVQDGKRVETRLIERVAATGDREKDYWHGAFAWREDESDAEISIDGADNVRGTQHDIPAQKECPACHLGDPGHILGFSSVQLSKPGDGTTLAILAKDGWLEVPPPETGYSIPGEDVVANAIGYLHANCGHCHNPDGIAWPDTDMVLRYDTTSHDVSETGLYKTTVGIPLSRFQDGTLVNRVTAGNVDESALVVRMSQRGDKKQMPPLATEFTDPKGIAIVSDWIRSLPHSP